MGVENRSKASECADEQKLRQALNFKKLAETACDKPQLDSDHAF